MKKIPTRFLLLAAILTITAACTASGVNMTEKDLLHHRFVLQSVDDKAYALKAPAPTLSFNEGMRVSGVICNNFMGQGTLDGKRLTVPQMASTRKLCLDPELNSYEQLIGKMLMNGVDMEYDGQIMTLRQGGHTLVYKLSDLVN